MKKDSKILIVSAIALVVSSAGLHFIHKANEGYPDISLKGETGEFLAVSNTEYSEEDELTQVRIKTNAPDGTILYISAQHPYTTNDLGQYTIVKNGRAKADIKMSSSLAATPIPVTVTLDMEQNQTVPAAVKIYGQKGENIIGEEIFDNGNGYLNAVISTEEFTFPNEAKYISDMFSSFLYYTIISNYSDIFASITPAEDGSWKEINIKLTEYGSAPESWNTVTDEILNGFYDFFEKMAKDAEVVSDSEKIKITFYDSQGNVLAQNY